jgi:hypothetical protein
MFLLFGAMLSCQLRAVKTKNSTIRLQQFVADPNLPLASVLAGKYVLLQ